MNKQILKKIDNMILNSKSFLNVTTPVLMRLPINAIKKNILLCKTEAIKGIPIVKSMPYRGVLNLTNTCNLRCNFCEITYFHEKFGNKHSNTVGMELIKKYSPWLKMLYSIDFYGSVGEPLMNKDLNEVVRFLKSEYGTRLFINTNGALLNYSRAHMLLENHFDDVLVSLHAGSEDIYNKLTGSNNFQQVVNNVKGLIILRKIFKKQKPMVGLAFALNSINSEDIGNFVKLVQDIGVDYIAVSHYYVGRNKFQNDISYFSNPHQGAMFLEWIYTMAKIAGIRMQPENPPYLNEHRPGIRSKCLAPWSSIKFEGCLERENSHYIAVCNRISLFRLDYDEFDFSKGVDAIWNHPVLQYLRKTVNSEDMNPICAFCRDESTAAIRCLDNSEYRRRRDAAIHEFFKRAREEFDMPEIKGLHVLKENPYG